MLSLEKQEALRRRYAAAKPGWAPSSQVYQDVVRSRLSSGSCVLDLGCGRGGVLERLHPEVRFAVGLDPDALSLHEHRLRRLPRTAGAAERLPFSDAAFDAALCSWVIEHLVDPAAALRELGRVLKPGGVFVFLTPNLLHPLVALNRLMGRCRAKVLPHLYDRAAADTFPVVYRANTLRALRKLAQATGFECRELLSVGDPTYLAFSERLFWLGRLLEALTPTVLKVHLVGVFVSL